MLGLPYFFFSGTDEIKLCNSKIINSNQVSISPTIYKQLNEDVNFTNILRADFSLESVVCSIFLLKVYVLNFFGARKLAKKGCL